jgi:hypothetical protein
MDFKSEEITMEQIDFFEGKRPQTTVLIVQKKRTITFTPWEEWMAIAETPFTLRCGNKRSKKFTRRRGIEHTQRMSFENNIGLSLGVKGIAALESSLKKTLGEEITLQEGTEEEEMHEFTSPECGCKVVKLFQRARVLHVHYRDTSYWHGDEKECTMVQWLAPIYDGTYATTWDPACGCDSGRDPGPPRDGLARAIVCGNAAKLAVEWSETNQLEFGDSEGSLNAFFPSGFGQPGDIPSNLLPDYLTFLAEIEPAATIRALVWPERPQIGLLGSEAEIRIDLGEDFQPLIPLEAEFVSAEA